MKKHIYIIVAAAATLTLSCNKENETPESVAGAGKVTFTATAAQTKTELQGGHTVWSANDQIKVFYGNGGYSVADIKTGEGTSHATYEASVPIGEDYHAVYPASVTSSLVDAGRLSITIPDVQDGTFGAGHIAVAKGIDKAFHFVNANSFLKITIPAGYRRIVVESVAGEPLSGPISVDLRGDDPVIIPGEGVSNKVEVASTSGLPAGDIYISVLAGVTHSGGLLLKYYDAIGLLGTFFLDKPLKTEASCIHSFGEFEATGEYFATLEGSGNKTGINPDNAMDLDALKALISMLEDPDKVAALAEALNGATIHIGPGTWNFQDALLLAFPGVSREVVVNIEGAVRSGGKNTTIITGAESHRLLNLGDNVNASFLNISFIDGLGNASGNSPILVKDEAKASFNGCDFTHCSNKKPDGTLATGGCIYADPGTDLLFRDCSFSSNTGSYGATLIVKGKATIENSHLFSNDGSWPGSAIYVDYGTAECNVANSVIEDNTVTKLGSDEPDGGAIAVIHGKITLTDCSLLKNSIPGRRGGALRTANSDSYAKLVNCTVKGNTADWGGAINIPAGTVEIQGGTYQDNYAKGGGCILMSGSGNLSVQGTLFKENHVTESGGAISVLNSDDSGLFLNGCTFTGNWIGYQDGTTIFVKNAGFLCMNNCTIADDTYASNAGGNASWIYVDNLANGLIISNCTLIGSARYSSSKTVDDTPTPLVKMANLANDKNYLINDIIIGEESHYSFGLTAGTAHTVNLDCTKFGTANMVVGSLVGTYDDGHSRGDFGVIEWDATDLIWKWNGTVTGANAFQIKAADFTTALNSANSNFKTWLQDIECINKDQLGSTRPGSGVWMPGAYQK
ncbi:MAG: hypothetical protein IKX62_04285 [Bacteroidales bacterium]|nr:hypothetical protein [Bacteroidales bacterium]